MMISKLKKSIAAIGIIVAIGIFTQPLPTLANTESLVTVKPPLISLNGTIRKLAVEGTCYQFTANEVKNMN
ncbi:MAG: hypothetical protein HC941_31950 [Microcoleus sp. SU_5_3]|nr:hypothetical protein [Microcoleus sp. SU_5_3]